MAPRALCLPAFALLCASFGCASEDYTRLYYTQPVAPSLVLDDLTTFDVMGPVLVDQWLNFCVY